MPPHHRVPPSSIASFIDVDRIDALLRPFVADDGERAFVVRCMLDEGPAHHRGANYVLLALLDELLKVTGGPAEGVSGPAVPVPMRVPPHLRGARGEHDFPLTLPTRPIERLAPAGSSGFAAMVDCLTDGPPQHALANAAMVGLLGALLERLAR